MKGMFREVLLEALELEMKLQLGYDKYYISKKQTINYKLQKW